MDVAVIPLDECLLPLEPSEDDLPSTRRLSGLDAKASRRRLERIDDVGKACRWHLRDSAVHPSTQPCEREGDDHPHRETPPFLLFAAFLAFNVVSGLPLARSRRYRHPMSLP